MAGSPVMGGAETTGSGRKETGSQDSRGRAKEALQPARSGTVDDAFASTMDQEGVPGKHRSSAAGKYKRLQSLQKAGSKKAPAEGPGPSSEARHRSGQSHLRSPPCSRTPQALARFPVALPCSSFA